MGNFVLVADKQLVVGKLKVCLSFQIKQIFNLIIRADRLSFEIE
jgi:hypothetical protein